MERQVRGWTLAELASHLHAELRGDPHLLITEPAPAGGGGPNSLTFAGDEKHLARANASEAGAVILSAGLESDKPCLLVDNPKLAFAQFLSMCARPLPLQKGVHQTAVVDPRAVVSAGASIGAYAVVERDAVISDGCRVYPHCYVGENCRLEPGVVLFPHVVLYRDVRIGARTVIHSGTVLGADGFGYSWDGVAHRKLPQVGAVVIAEDCEIGVLSAIDRATMGETSVGKDTKIDNLVQVGHNTRLGQHVVLAAGVGISGSCDVGDNVTMAGMVGVGDHVSIPSGTTIAARSATTTNVKEPGVYMGFPLRPVIEEQRINVLLGRLPQMARRLADLEKRLAELESKEA